MPCGLQVPLILAWALSIHKSQGQTLERVRVDLNRTFEKGQGASYPLYFDASSVLSQRTSLAYVALSRATRMETLQVVNFDPAKYVRSTQLYSCILTVNWIVRCRVRAHPRVLEWMAEHMDKVPDLPYIPDGEDEDVNKLLDFWA